MKNNDLILPSNLRPADGEMQISVLRGKMSGIIYIRIEGTDGKIHGECSLNGEQGFQLIKNIASAMPELRLKIEGEGAIN